MRTKKILYCDLDGVLVDLEAYVLRHDHYGLDQVPISKRNEGFSQQFENSIKAFSSNAFLDADPMIGSTLAFPWLCKHFDVYLLSTPMWDHPQSYVDKRHWVEHHLGEDAKKRLILTHNKGLMKGDYLIDDRIKHGVEDFEGEHIHFGQPGLETWFEVMNYLKQKENI